MNINTKFFKYIKNIMTSNKNDSVLGKQIPDTSPHVPMPQVKEPKTKSKGFMTIRLNYGEDCKFKTVKEVLDFFEDDLRAASHSDLFGEVINLEREIKKLKKTYGEDL
jgi:hypothetical protein